MERIRPYFWLFLIFIVIMGCAKTAKPKKTTGSITTSSLPPMAAYNAPGPAPKPEPVAPLVKGETFSARQGLALAQEEAKKVQSDANIMSCSTSKVGEDGKAEKWIYVFWSPSAQQKVSVTINLGESAGSQSEATTEDLWNPMAMMVKWTTDSSKALSAALKSGLKKELEKYPGAAENLNMKIELSQGVLAWEIKANEKKIPPYFVDGATGRFINTGKPVK